MRGGFKLRSVYKLRGGRKRKARILDVVVPEVREHDILADFGNNALTPECSSIFTRFLEQCARDTANDKRLTARGLTRFAHDPHLLVENRRFSWPEDLRMFKPNARNDRNLTTQDMHTAVHINRTAELLMLVLTSVVVLFL